MAEERKEPRTGSPARRAGSGESRRGIAGWPEDDRPREKLFRLGEHNLSDAELLAILLNSGAAGEDALSLARRILARFNGSFREMSHTSERAWDSFRGLGPAKRARLRAALEIGRRFREVEERRERKQLKSPTEVVAMMGPRMADLRNEVFKIVCLDGRNRVLSVEEITEGSPNSAHPLVREIVSVSLDRFAASIIALHNHPSGEPEPSREDRLFTRRLKDACEAVGLSLLDHIIIGDRKHYSFSESGVL